MPTSAASVRFKTSTDVGIRPPIFDHLKAQPKTDLRPVTGSSRRRQPGAPRPCGVLAQGGEQITNLVVDLLFARDCVSDLRAEHLAIPMTEPMDSDLQRPFAPMQLGGELSSFPGAGRRTLESGPVRRARCTHGGGHTRKGDTNRSGTRSTTPRTLAVTRPGPPKARPSSGWWQNALPPFDANRNWVQCWTCADGAAGINLKSHDPACQSAPEHRGRSVHIPVCCQPTSGSKNGARATPPAAWRLFRDVEMKSRQGRYGYATNAVARAPSASGSWLQ